VDEHLEARQSVLLIQGYHVQQTGQSEHVDHSRNGTSKSAIITQLKSINLTNKIKITWQSCQFWAGKWQRTRTEKAPTH
jgi:hypothetical protein